MSTASPNNNDEENAFQEEEKGEETNKWSNQKRALVGTSVGVLTALLVFLLVWFLGDDGGNGDPDFPPRGTDTDTTAPTTLTPTTSPSTSPTINPTTSPTASPSSSPSSAPTIITLPPVSTDTVCSEYDLIDPIDGMMFFSDNNNNSSSNSTNETIPTENWIQVGEDIIGEDPLDFSGAALALSADGRIVAVSATENDDFQRNSGHVRVFELTKINGTHGFQQLGQDLDGDAEEDWFGESLAMDSTGYRLAVGAGWNDGNNPQQQAYNSGHVRIYDYNFTSEQWQMVEELNGPSIGIEFGKSVSMSADGTRLAVGASHCRGSQNLTRVGCVYLFEFNEMEAWVPLGEVLEGEAQGDEFGTSVQLSEDGSTLAVGAYRHDVGINGTDAGQVALFSFDRSSDLFEPNGVIEGELPSEWVGMAIAMSQDGSRVAVGYHDRQVTVVPGFTRVYEQVKESTEWRQIGLNDLTGGFAVSMSRDGSRLAVGDHRGRTGGANSGHIYIYGLDEEATEWEIAGLAISGNAQEMAGIDVELSADGQRVAITAPFAGSSSGVPQAGATRVYDLCKVSQTTAISKIGFEK